MKRRHVLFLGATALAGGAWLLRPENTGAPHDHYFQTLNDALKQQGPGRPLMVLDRARLHANCRALKALVPSSCQLRIVTKSLPSVPLIQDVMTHTGSHRLMVFHQPFMNALANAEPNADMLLGKPMPVQAAKQFYRELAEHKGSQNSFDPDTQLQWLIDTHERLEQYLQLARTLNRRLRINIEIDVGLHRGGLTDPQQLDALIRTIEANPQLLSFSGFMGYDAHVGKLPAFIQSAEQGHQETETQYRRYIARLYQLAPHYRERALCFNGAGSPTLALYDDTSVVNELSAGSCLVKARDFDLPHLAAFQPAIFIAAPILKSQPGLALPGPIPLGDAWQQWDANRQHTYFIYGGYWKAEPVSPAGVQANTVYGASTNQMMFNSSARTALEVDDQLFFRPTQSEFVMLQFGDIAVWENAALQTWWPPLPHGTGA